MPRAAPGCQGPTGRRSSGEVVVPVDSGHPGRPGYVLHGGMSVHAVLFDLDGTLVDSERQYAEAMARALADGLGVVIDQDDRDHVIGRSWVAIHQHLVARYPAIVWDRDQLIARTVVASHRLFAEEGVRVLPGAVAAVGRFAGLRRGLVTGSARAEARPMLDHLGLAAAFEVVLCAEDVARSKPAPDGYLDACRRLAVAPVTTLVIEDSTAGIAAARAAGCAVVAVAAGNFAGQDQSGAHRRVDTLDEITPELAAAVVNAAAAGYGHEQAGR